MAIEVQITGDVVVIRIQNPEDARTGVLGPIVRNGCHRRFILDIRDLLELDSDGLAEIVRAYVFVNRQRRSFVLINPTTRVKELLFITELSFLLQDAEGDEQAGVASRLRPRKPTGTMSASIPLSDEDAD
jgi:anti-anti-sigma factor